MFFAGALFCFAIILTYAVENYFSGKNNCFKINVVLHCGLTCMGRSYKYAS
jgi:hypothetical protein